MAFPGLTVAIMLVLLGLFVGALSGMIGIGGGAIVIPILMMAFGFTQAKANGTSLAMMLPPVGVMAVLSYWKAGNIDLAYALLMAAGFLVGAFVGAYAANAGWVNAGALRVLLSIMLLYIVGRMLFRSESAVRNGTQTAMLVLAFMGTYLVLRIVGKKMQRLPAWIENYGKPSAADGGTMPEER